MKTTWPEVRLGDVCTFNYGKSLPARQRSGGGAPVFGSNGAVGMHNSPLTSGPTIVVGRKGSFGEVHYSDGPCYPIDTTYWIDEGSTTANLRWLYWRLRSLGLTSLNRAAAVPGLNRDDAYARILLLPPLAEQRRIAAILDKTDELRFRSEASRRRVDSLESAIFFDIFGDPRTNPKNLDTATLGELVRVRSGDGIQVRRLEQSGRVPVYGGNGIVGFGDAENVHEPTVVIGRVGAYCGNVHLTDSPCWVSDNALFVAERSSVVDLPYLAAAMKTADLNQYASQAGQPLISGSRVYPVRVLVPPLETQREFSAAVLQTRRLAASVDVGVRGMNELLASLRHRAFTGQL